MTPQHSLGWGSILNRPSPCLKLPPTNQDRLSYVILLSTPPLLKRKYLVPNLQATSVPLIGHENYVSVVVPVPHQLAVNYQPHGAYLDLGDMNGGDYYFLLDWI